MTRPDDPVDRRRALAAHVTTLAVRLELAVASAVELGVHEGTVDMAVVPEQMRRWAERSSGPAATPTNPRNDESAPRYSVQALYLGASCEDKAAMMNPGPRHQRRHTWRYRCNAPGCGAPLEGVQRPPVKAGGRMVPGPLLIHRPCGHSWRVGHGWA